MKLSLLARWFDTLFKLTIMSRYSPSEKPLSFLTFLNVVQIYTVHNREYTVQYHHESLTKPVGHDRTLASSIQSPQNQHFPTPLWFLLVWDAAPQTLTHWFLYDMLRDVGRDSRWPLIRTYRMTYVVVNSPVLVSYPFQVKTGVRLKL